jgi:hypothetical protein
MTASTTMSIEAALYNEHTLAWEPLIEPTLVGNQTRFSPWNIVCSITPVSQTDLFRRCCDIEDDFVSLDTSDIISCENSTTKRNFCSQCSTINIDSN